MAPSEHHPLAAVEGFVVVAGDSTNGELAKEWRDTLQLHEPNREVQLVLTGNSEDLSLQDLEERNRHRLAVALGAGNTANKMVIVGGGDGSVHYALRALLHNDMPASAKDAILTSWALGRANDFYFATQDGSMVGYPMGTLEHPDAHIFDAHPMEIIDEAGNVIDLAAMYWTGGATAVAAAIFASHKHRECRKRIHAPDDLIDVIGGAPALWLPEQYEISVNGGEPRKTAEVQITKGDRMAEKARFPSRLSHGKEVFLSVVGSNSPLAVGATAVRMMTGHARGELQTVPISIANTGKKPMPTQADGEIGSLKPGSTITIQASERHVRVWATKKDV
ncbi:MAG: diacylglycerol kinase family protein [Candidatus Saccharimonadales bacterium]